MGTFNTYGNKSRKYGGSNPVWLTVSQKERVGGVLTPLPPVGTVIRAGTLVSLDGAGGKVHIIPTVEIDEVSANRDVLQIKSPFFRIEKGMHFARLDDDPLNELGKGFSISTTDDIVYDPATHIYTVKTSFCYSAINGGDVVVGCNLSAMYSFDHFPTGLTENDVWIEEGDEYATVASVYHGEIMEDRIQPIPDRLKAFLPMIKFVKGV